MIFIFLRIISYLTVQRKITQTSHFRHIKPIENVKISVRMMTGKKPNCQLKVTLGKYSNNPQIAEIIIELFERHRHASVLARARIYI